MALTKSIFFTDISGVEREVSNAYIVVSGLRSSKLQSVATVQAKTEKDGNIIAESEHAFVPDYSDGAKNGLAQAYSHLKMLPEFADAVDC